MMVKLLMGVAALALVGSIAPAIAQAPTAQTTGQSPSKQLAALFAASNEGEL